MGNKNNTLENWQQFLESIGVPYIVSEDKRYDEETDDVVTFLMIELCVTADYLDEMHTEEYLKWFFITKNHPTIDIYFDKDTHEFIGFTPGGE